MHVQWFAEENLNDAGKNCKLRKSKIKQEWITICWESSILRLKSNPLSVAVQLFAKNWTELKQEKIYEEERNEKRLRAETSGTRFTNEREKESFVTRIRRRSIEILSEICIESLYESYVRGLRVGYSTRGKHTHTQSLCQSRDT